MPLAPCRERGKDVSTEAAACPHCGAAAPTRQRSGDWLPYPEERTTGKGLAHVEPLWGESPESLVRELLERGYRTRLTSIDLARAPREWLGRELDSRLLDEILASDDVDPAGERGEYHSYVFDGPLFRAPVTVATGEVHEEEGHAMIELIART